MRAIGSNHARWVVYKNNGAWHVEDRVTGIGTFFPTWREAFDYGFDIEWKKNAKLRKLLEETA